MNGWIYGVRQNKTLASVFVIAFLAAFLFGTLKATAADFLTVTAALIPGLDLRRETDLPTVLSAVDAERYRLVMLRKRPVSYAA